MYLHFTLFPFQEKNGCFSPKHSRVSSSSKSPGGSNSSNNHPLFSHGVCQWPGCEAVLDSPSHLQPHLDRAHPLNDATTAHTRVQVQIVSQLKAQLKKEEDRLEAMMDHLHPPPTPQSADKERNSSPTHGQAKSFDVMGGLGLSGLMTPPGSLGPAFPGLTAPAGSHHAGSAGRPVNGSRYGGQQHSEPRPHKIPLPPGLYCEKNSSQIDKPEINSFDCISVPYHDELSPRGGSSGRGNSNSGCSNRDFGDSGSGRGGGGGGGSHLDPENEISRNRDFYRSQDVRPPFTYAALIRQVR